ncbi:MAG: S41 family peptidase [Defluviitaleaceae bacterium]|nr:S41 family peptidase [Defluviitaleaceae bacterium]
MKNFRRLFMIFAAVFLVACDYDELTGDVGYVGDITEVLTDPAPPYEVGTVPVFPYFARPEQPLQDFHPEAFQIVSFLEATHANFAVDGRIPAGYDNARDEYLLITQNYMTHTEFTLQTQRFLASMNDGHLSRTFLMIDWENFQQTLFQDGYFTESTFLARGDRLFLVGDDGRITDREVMSIGGALVPHLFHTIDTYFGRYNETGRERARGRYAASELMVRRAGGRVGYDVRVFVEVVFRDGESLVMPMHSLHPTRYRDPSIQPPYHVRHEMVGDVMVIALPAVLQLGPNLDELVIAIENAIAEGIRKFILDLRSTPGGNTHFGDAVLRAMGITPPAHGKYLRVSPYMHIDGFIGMRYFSHLSEDYMRNSTLIYVPRNQAAAANPYGVTVAALTSPRTFSGGTTLAVEVQDGGFGPVIGEPSATAPTGYGWGTNMFGPLSDLQIRPHVSLYLRPDPSADQLTLHPDILVDEQDALEVALDFMANLP